MSSTVLHRAHLLQLKRGTKPGRFSKTKHIERNMTASGRKFMEPAVLADECRRTGNELYRAACLLAQQHADAHGDGVTFGGEGAAVYAKAAME